MIVTSIFLPLLMRGLPLSVNVVLLVEHLFYAEPTMWQHCVTILALMEPEMMTPGRSGTVER
jgi:hypothetical protein